MSGGSRHCILTLGLGPCRGPGRYNDLFGSVSPLEFANVIHVSLSARSKGLADSQICIPTIIACLTIKAVCWTLIEVSFRLPALWPGGFATIDLIARAPAASRFFTLLLLKVMLVIPALIYRPGLVSGSLSRLASFDIVSLEPEPTTVPAKILSGLCGDLTSSVKAGTFKVP